MEVKQISQRYQRIDGLRAFASVGIVLMHIQANAGYQLTGFIAERLLPSFTNLVFLFMIISGFSVCCGYYDKIVSGKMPLDVFYKKRFAKVWPFFAILCIIDLIVSPSLESIYEVLANLTLCFGFIPDHDIGVIGVGWFLGLVFVFYFLFPFFCYLLSDRKRAWISFCVTMLLNFLCVVYFKAGRTSIAYSAVFFMAGGMLYRYRDFLAKLANKHGMLLLAIVALFAALYFLVGPLEPIMLLLYSAMLIYALGEERRHFDLLSNGLVSLLSGVSMEIYLSHMFIFRLIEKFAGEMLMALPDGVAFLITALITISGTVAFSFMMQKLIKWAGRYFRPRA